MNFKSGLLIFSFFFFLFCSSVSGLILPIFAATVSQTKITLVSHKNFSPSELLKLKKIIHNLHTVINSNEFKLFVKENKIGNDFKFEDNNNQSNEIIYNNIISGAEKLSPIVDNEWQLHFEKKWMITRTVNAYTYESSPIIFFNSRYFSSGDEPAIAGTICHEYTHKLGYKHDLKETKKRPNSVPYAVGGICSFLYEQYFPLPSYKFNPTIKKEVPSCSLFCKFKRLFSVID